MATVTGQRENTLEGAISVLIVDDNPIDAELAQMELRRARVSARWAVARDEPSLRAALLVFVPDVVLCDFSFPNLDGFKAQAIVRERYPHVPLIFVSGSISEARVAKALQSGAVDYVMKSHIARLPDAVLRAVTSARERTLLAAAAAGSEARARRQVERFEALWRVVNNSEFRGTEFGLAMLYEAAGAMRADQAFIGILRHAEGNGYVIDASTADFASTGGTALQSLQIGVRTEASHSFHANDRSIVRTKSWDDLDAMEDRKLHGPGVLWRSLIVTLFHARDKLYELTLASLEKTTTPFASEDYAYIEVLASVFARQLELEHLEESLRNSESIARRHAERLEALWKIVNDPRLGEAEMWLKMLETAGASIRPGQQFWSSLWRVDGDNAVLEAASERPDDMPNTGSYPAGRVISLNGSWLGSLLADGGGTRSWDDVYAGVGSEFVSRHGTRSLILTTFVAGESTWALSFSSASAARHPLGSLEHAYIEVLASFFSNHLQQRWQFQRLEHQRRHDVLTGLVNRAQFQAEVLARSKELAAYAIVLVDINAFRDINESYGHSVGDSVLVEIAAALSLCALPDEIVGRVGGDVFAIFVPDEGTAAFVSERAGSFAAVFGHAFSAGKRGHKGHITRSASLGVAVAPRDGVSIAELLSHGDAALAAAKERGPASVVFYEVGMELEAQQRADLLDEIGQACATDQFRLYFQPHVELATGKVTGCEALIRWNHPKRGLVMPGDFIPFAERTGVIQMIDDWVMKHSFAAAKELAEFDSTLRVFFNLSARQAGDGKLIGAFTEAARNGVALENIGVEITETDAMRDVEATRRVFRELRRLNVKIAIDDFGTGYSSLSSLKQLPVDVVKIDRSFVSGVTTDRHDAAIAQTIVAIAKHFGFASLGEGAETQAEIDWLGQNGCLYAQGYKICRPIPMEAFKAWLVEYASQMQA